MRPNPEIWRRVNLAIVNENAAEALVTIINGLSMLLVHAGVCTDERHGRAHLAAMLASPDDGEPGTLMPAVAREVERLRREGMRLN